MKLPKEQLYPGVCYHTKIYNEDYIIEFERFGSNGEDIYVGNYYYNGKLYEGSCHWGYYKDTTELQIATEFPKEIKSSIISSYEIY